MRRVFRIGLMATAATAVFFYLAASYALHHPESLLTQCVVTSFHLGTEHNPFFKMGQTLGRSVHKVSQADPADSELTIEEEEQPLCVPPDAENVPQAVEHQAVCPERNECLINTIKEQLLNQPKENTQKSKDSPFMFYGEVPLCTSAPKDEKDFPTFMPPCTDEGENSAVMHGAGNVDSKSSTDSLLNFWLGLFGSVTKEAGEMNGVEAQETSHYFHDEEPPQCLEDPAYQYQYPGCPFTGKCPKSEPSATPKIVDPVPSVKPKSIKKQSGTQKETQGNTDPLFHTFDPKKYELPARLRQLLPGDSTEAEEEPSHPEVDTTEFRPADGKPGEFDPKRM